MVLKQCPVSFRTSDDKDDPAGLRSTQHKLPTRLRNGLWICGIVLSPVKLCVLKKDSSIFR